MTELTQIINKSLNAGAEEYQKLIAETTELLASERGHIGTLNIEGRLARIPASGEAIIIGDIHGDLESLHYILKASQFIEKLSEGRKIVSIFLGDYGDRGPNSAEVYYVILRLKQLFPENVLLVRGNHEGPDDLLAHPHDLPQSLQRRFGDTGLTLYSNIRLLFPHFYNAVIVNGFYAIVHGGVPSQASSLEDLTKAHLKHPKESHLEELLWSDPAEDIRGTLPSPRGAGRLFGADITKNFLEIFNLTNVIRGHEPTQAGYKHNHNNQILTLFSRKGSPYFNSTGAYLHINLSFEQEINRRLNTFIKRF